MSITADEQRQIADKATEFLKLYYKEEAYELARLFPRDKRSLDIEWSDLNTFDPTLADDFIESPDELKPAFDEGLRQLDNPVGCDFTSDEFGDATVRVTLPDSKCYGVGELRAQHSGKYLGVSGKMERITDPIERATNLAFECDRCGTITQIPQGEHGSQEPHECMGCGRQGPFSARPTHPESKLVDQAKILLKQPPDESGARAGQGSQIEAYVTEDLIEYGGPYGLAGRVGEDVTVYGTVELRQRTDGRSKTSAFERYFSASSIAFEAGDAEIDVNEYKDEFRRYAAMDNPYDIFARSIAPEIETTQGWRKAELMGTAYLFAAPRIDPENGPTYRGDIHMAIFGDPGMAKSVFLRAIDDISPDSVRRSATGLASDVGLTAAAVKDDFGEGQYTLKPGILVQGGAHTVIDEIDKGPENLNRINNALEGDQMITVSKGGLHASLKTRTGLLVSGNPEQGRFDKYVPVGEQIDVDPTLLSRFDGIITLQDSVDEDQDRAVGGHILRSYRESASMEKKDRGETVDQPLDQEATQRDVPIEVMQAWVKYARETIFPEIPEHVEEELREFYVDVRGQNSDSDSDALPATARKLEAGIRYAIAFARLRLSETVELQDAQMAIDLSRKIIGETFDPEEAVYNADQTNEAQQRSQQKKINAILHVLPGPGEDPITISEIASRADMEHESVEHRIDKLRNQREPPVTERGDGRYRKL